MTGDVILLFFFDFFHSSSCRAYPVPEIIILLVAARKSPIVVTENHVMRLFSQEILHRPGPRFPAIFPYSILLSLKNTPYKGNCENVVKSVTSTVLL